MCLFRKLHFQISLYTLFLSSFGFVQSYNDVPFQCHWLNLSRFPNNSASGPQRTAPPAVTQLSPTLLTFTAASVTSPPNNRRGIHLERAGGKGQSGRVWKEMRHCQLSKGSLAVQMIGSIHERKMQCPCLNWCGTCHHNLINWLSQTSADTIMLSTGLQPISRTHHLIG